MESTNKEIIVPVDGMTLRDYFAAKVIHALLMIEKDEDGTSLMDLAELAYLTADAMLEQREEEQ